jgi:hypothetical protein
MPGTVQQGGKLQNQLPRQGRPALLGGLVLAALLGMYVIAGAMAIGELPAADRPDAWRMFWLGWLLVSIGVGSTFVPQWRAGTVIPQSAHEQAANLARMKRMAALGGPLGLLGGMLSFLGANLWVAFFAIAGGLTTAVLLLGIALHTTRKGRAMLRRRRL